MSNATLIISGGTPPYTISVKKSGDNVERFVSYNGGTLYFNSDPSASTYDIFVNDSDSCEYQSTFSLNCTPKNPSFTYTYTQPSCIPGGTWFPAQLRWNDLTASTRYVVCYNTTTFNCDCNNTTGNPIGGGFLTFNAPTVAGIRNIVIRVFNGNSCDFYTDILFTEITPECGNDCDISINLGTPSC